MKKSTNYGLSFVTILLIVAGTVSAIPMSLYNTLQGYDGHHSQEDSPDQPAFLLADGLDVSYVNEASSNPTEDETIIFDAVGAHFGTVLADDPGRNYIRTLETDNISASFDAYVTVIDYGQLQNVFFGVGAGQIGLYQCPDWDVMGVKSVWIELMQNDNFPDESAINTMIWDGATSDFLRPGERLPFSSTYLLRLSYNADEQIIVFMADADNDGTWDAETREISVEDLFTETDESRIFIGSDDSAVLINFEIVPANPYLAFGFDPPNGATLVPDDKILNWQVSSDITDALFDVYLGTDPNEGNPDYYGNYKIEEMLAETSCDPDIEKDTTYYWRVDVLEPNDAGGYVAHTGSMLRFTTVPLIPVITTHPASQTVEIGGSATFTVEGLNFETFAWYKEGNPTVVSEQQELVLANVQLADEGRYYCAVTNGYGTVMSDMAGLWTKRLIGWWKLDGDAIDSVNLVVPGAPVHNGTLPADPNFLVGGIDGGAYEFFGDGRVIIFPDTGTYFNFHPQGMTASVWMKSYGTTTWDGVISKHDRPTDVSDDWFGWVIDLNGSEWAEHGAHFTLRHSHGDLFGNDDDGEMVDGEWYLFTAVMDPDTQTSRVYVNGTLKNESSVYDFSSIILTEDPFVFGAEDQYGSVPYTGMIDDVKIWSYPLGPIEIARLYTDFNPSAEVCIEQNDPWRYYDVVGEPGEPSYCIVDIADFAEFIATWMECNIVPSCLP